MTIEEMEHLISRHAAIPATSAMARFAVNQAIGEMDEAISGFGGPMGRQFSFVDMTAGRDTYPVRGFVRIAHVERMDVATSPWPLSPTTPGQIVQADIRGAYGGFWAAVDGGIIIYPTPTETTKNGLRVWGYMSRELPLDAPPERDLGLSNKELPYVLWRAAESLATDSRMRERASKERERAERTLRMYIEQPTTGVSPDQIVVEP